MAAEEWRIDELAHRSGVSVDTIRFYQRDGLLPPAHREGRAIVYGPAHLRRLEMIRDLQARHFNLAAVKALLAESRLGAIQALFSADAPLLSRAELTDRAGVDPALVARLHATGLLVDPAETGLTGYDQAEVDVLIAVRELTDLGLPEPVVLFIAGLYASHFGAMQQDVAALFEGKGEIDWPEDARRAFVDGLGERVAEVFGLTARLLNYAHQATVRRMTLTTPVTPDAIDSRPDDPDADVSNR